MTYLQAINAVLTRLRLGTVSLSGETEYSSMIGELVNQAKREVEDAWMWLALEAELNLQTVSGTNTYILTGWGQRSRIRRLNNLTNQIGALRAVDRDQLNRWKDFSQVENNIPSYWIVNGLSSGDPIIEVYPTPDSVYSINVYGIVPQADLTIEETVITVPYWPVVLGAYVLALAERGDDRGAPEERAQKEYMSALSDAIAHDNLNRNAGWTSDWRVA